MAIKHHSNETFLDSNKLMFGTGEDLQILHDGTDSYLNNTTGDLKIRNLADDKDIVFESDNGSGGATAYLTLDGSRADGTYVYTTMPDYGVMAFGASVDMQLYHNGTDSTIRNNTGNLNIVNFADDSDIVFESDDGSGGTTPYITLDGSIVETKFNKDLRVIDNEKIIAGTSNDLEIFSSGAAVIFKTWSGNMTFQQNHNDSDIIFQCDDGSGGTTTYLTIDGGAETVEVAKPLNITGDTAITGHLDVTASSASGSPLIRFNQTTTRRGFIQMADTNNNLRVASEYGSVSLEAASSEGSDSDTSYIRIQPGGTVEIGAVDGDATIATDGNMTFRIDADNDETTQKFAFQNNASTEVANLDEEGNLSLDGRIILGTASDTTIARDSAGIVTIEGAEVVTHKKLKQIYFQNFVDDLGTTKHYLPWKTQNEQTVRYQEEAAMVAIADGRIVSVTVRLGSLTSGSGNLTIGIETGAAGVSYAGTWTVEETESIAITNTDDHHVAHFAFDNAKHFESTDLVAISIQSDVDLHSAAQFWYVSTVVEYDYTTFLGETSAEFTTTP